MATTEKLPGTDMPSVLPKTDPAEVARLRLAPTGGIELDLTTPLARRIFAATKLDERVRGSLILRDEEGEFEVPLGGAVKSETHALKKVEGVNVVKATRSIAFQSLGVGTSADEDEDDDDPEE